MDERYLYNSDYKFEGSIDDNGNIYNERHWRIGRVDGNTIYDTCNIRCGHIDDDGRVVDLRNLPIGREMGSCFWGWDGHGSGLVQGGVSGDRRGNDYGVFSLVKDSNRKYGVTYGSEENIDGEDETTSDGDGGDDDYSDGEEENGCGANESGDYYEEEDNDAGDNDDWGCSPQKPKRAQRKQTRGGGNGRRKSGGGQTPANGAAGCFDAITSLAMIIVVIVMICNLIKSCWNGEIHL